MRNASISDVKKAQEQMHLEPDVMYIIYGDYRIHGVNSTEFSRLTLKTHGLILFEPVNGTNIGVFTKEDLSYIRPISPKGSATTPKKPKKEHKKGTRPFHEVPYDAGTKLKADDKVRMTDGSVHTIYSLSLNKCWSSLFTDTNRQTLYTENIKSILLPYGGPKKEVFYKMGDRVYICGTEYILAQAGPCRLCLINIFSGNRFNELVSVESPYSVTEEIMKCLTCGYEFTLIPR